ncbi:MAG: type II secretion system F family protein [Candidatus Woesearchaeota archaeon]
MSKFMRLMHKIVYYLVPELSIKLRQAGIADEPDDYIKKTVVSSFFAAIGLSFIFFLFFPSFSTFLTVFLLYPILFLYFLRYVDIKIQKLKRLIDQEIIFAGNFLIIELESGVPIHKAFENIEKNYEVVGVYFGDIINRVYLGTSLEDAINETMIISPSPNLRRILWQVLNSLRSGADIGASLTSVINHVVRDQQIAVKEYGKKLSPLAMFYMMVSIIVPSLGITMLIVLATFLGLNITMPVYLTIALILGFIQFMFLSMVQSQRPPISG